MDCYQKKYSLWSPDSCARPYGVLMRVIKKNRKRYEIVMKKMEEILQNPHHYKTLSHDMKHLRRVHIDRSFVLVFYIDENNEIVFFTDIDHHDKIYGYQKD